MAPHRLPKSVFLENTFGDKPLFLRPFDSPRLNCTFSSLSPFIQVLSLLLFVYFLPSGSSCLFTTFLHSISNSRFKLHFFLRKIPSVTLCQCFEEFLFALSPFLCHYYNGSSVLSCPLRNWPKSKSSQVCTSFFIYTIFHVFIRSYYCPCLSLSLSAAADQTILKIDFSMDLDVPRPPSIAEITPWEKTRNWSFIRKGVSLISLSVLHNKPSSLFISLLFVLDPVCLSLCSLHLSLSLSL